MIKGKSKQIDFLVKYPKFTHVWNKVVVFLSYSVYLLFFSETMVVMVGLYGIISLLALYGNSLVIWIVAGSRSMHDVINFYISNLALSDIFLAIFCIPFQFYAALEQRWDLPEFMCKFCPFVQTFSINVNTLTLMAIAHER